MSTSCLTIDDVLHLLSLRFSKLTSPTQFFTRLTSLFSHRRTSSHGSIYLTQKRRTSPLLPILPPPSQASTKLSPVSPNTPPPSTPTAPFADLNPSQPLPILIRATNGKSKKHRENGEKFKVSTIVQPDEIEGFFVRYAEVMKGGMSALKKRDRSGRKKKEKERQKAKKKEKGGNEGS